MKKDEEGRMKEERGKRKEERGTAQRIHKRGGYLIWPQRRGRKENQEGSRRSGKLFERSEFFPRG